jgi:hypothetical protein
MSLAVVQLVWFGYLFAITPLKRGGDFVSLPRKMGMGLPHKVHIYIYIEYHSVCPLVGIGTLPPPLSPANVPLPPPNQRVGTLACGWGVGLGGVPTPTTGEKISHLPTLRFACCLLFISIRYKDAIGFLCIELLLDNYRLFKYCNV